MLTGGSGGIPSDGGVGPGPPLEAFMMLPRYCGGGLGEVADDTEDESKERVDRLGDRANAACGGAAMINGHLATGSVEGVNAQVMLVVANLSV